MAHDRRFDPAELAKRDAPERTGDYTFALLDGAVRPGLVHAIDPSAPMLDESRERYPGGDRETRLKRQSARPFAI